MKNLRFVLLGLPFASSRLGYSVNGFGGAPKKFTAISACVAALLLPSCFTWHTADGIRESYITHTGVDIFHPVDGNIYHEQERSPETGKLERNGTSYVIAPEITYTESPMNLHSLLDKPETPRIANVRPTGRTLIARCHGSYFSDVAEKLPKGLIREAAPPLPEGGIRSSHVGNIGRPRCEQPGLGGSLLIGSCDYVFDPLLTVVTVPVTCAAAAVVLPCALVIVPCQAAQKQQQEPETTSSEQSN